MKMSEILNENTMPSECFDKKDWQVLIVDDQAPFRQMVKSLLSREEIFSNIYEASDGREALSFLEGEGSDVDLILMDITMPNMDGIEAIGKLRSSEQHCETPVLVLSMDGRSEMKARGLSIGASDYVVKPFDQGELMARVKMLLRRKKVQDELKCKNLEMMLINQRLKELAATDELTKLSTRTLFFEKLESEMKRCARHKIKMTLMMADMDDFKKVNDTFGHVAGDEVLRGVSQILKDSIRDSDVAARYGGEEFVAYLVHTGISESAVPTERFRSTVEKTEFAFDGRICRQTVSIGVAEFPSADGKEAGVDFIKRADDALYEAKRLGKNRIVSAGAGRKP